MKGPDLEAVFDRVQWTAVPGADDVEVGDVPHATHVGVLEIGPCRMECARLSNGQAVITEDGMRQFLEWMGLTGGQEP